MPETTRSARRSIHPESLLRIPLVAAALSHLTVRRKQRGIDHRWRYDKIVERTLSGFVPLGDTVFYARHSRLAEWLRHPKRSARLLNDGDYLAGEVLFCVHDHLHAWAIAAVREHLPDLVVTPRRTPDDLEDLAFVHLATEAAATVGLDYWYLSTLEPDAICDIGTTSMPLTTRYHERHLKEYRRARPDLVVQDPEFLIELAGFYASGEFAGVDGGDLARSPLLARWLNHEVRYGAGQRVYIREWLAFLAGTHAGLERPTRAVRGDARWQRALLRDLAERLWQYVKHGVDCTSSHGRARSVTSRAARRSERPPSFDPRFVNIQTMSIDEVLAAASSITDPIKLSLVCDQLICAHEYSRFDKTLLPALVRAQEARDVRALVAVLGRCPRVAPEPDEPTRLFLLN